MQSVGLADTDDGAQVAAAPPPAAAPAPSQNAFCQAVARQEIQGQSYDPATQAEVVARSYRQCVALHPDAR